MSDEPQLPLPDYDTLRAAGWRQVGGTIRGKLLWRDPVTRALCTTGDALARLAHNQRREAAQARRPPEAPAGRESGASPA